MLNCLAGAFAPHVLRPQTYSTSTDGEYRLRRKRLQKVFMLLLLFFLKRKHNLMTSSERESMDVDSDAALEQLLFTEAAASTKLSRAFENAIATQPTVGGAGIVSDNVFQTRTVQDSQIDSKGAGVEVPVHAPQAETQDSVVIASRRVIENIVEVKVDPKLFDVVPPQDTWSIFADSGDEAVGLSDASDSSLSSPASLRKSNDTFHKAETSLIETEVSAPIYSIEGAITNSSKRNRIACNWLKTPEEAHAEEALLRNAPNLERWLQEPFLPHGSQPQPDFYQLDPPPTSSVFDVTSSNLGSSAESDVVNVPPGDSLLVLLGPDFSPPSSNENSEGDFTTIIGEGRNDTLLNTSRSLNTSARLLQQPSAATAAINYDYALAFPRTVTDVRKRPFVIGVVDRFLSYPNRTEKVDYFADSEKGLLNHTLADSPKPHDKTCQSCGIKFTSIFLFTSSHRRTYCRYCGKVLCRSCCNRQFVVPAHLISHGDFGVHTICRACENHLQGHLYSATLEFDRLLPAAVESIGRDRINSITALRCEALRYLYFCVLPDCPSRHTLIALLPQNCVPYLSVFPDSCGARVSLADLCELQTPHTQLAMEKTVILLREHIRDCTQCSNICRRCCASECCNRAVESLNSNHMESQFDASQREPFEELNTSHPSVLEDAFDDSFVSSPEFVEPALLTVLDSIELCRTCSRYCCTACFKYVEAQCCRCARYRPDAAPVTKHCTIAGLEGLVGCDGIDLWDVADHNYFSRPS